MSEMMALRLSYAFSESPITDDNAAFNVGSPLILQHSLNVGATMRLGPSLVTHLAYYYAPQNEVNSPFASPAGPVPGSNLSYRVSAHAISVGMTASF
jgi:long-subunit fatty acid transport protein